MSSAAPAIAVTPIRKSALRLLVWLSVIALIAGLGVWAVRAVTRGKQIVVPTVRVQRGDLSMAITARAELRGGNPETLVVPMTGGEQHITMLLKPGDQVKAGDVVVQLNTSEQEFKLKEAESDLAEAEQHLLQAKAQNAADSEDDAYALSKAKSDLTLAELDVRKNPIKAAIEARQNDLALEAARDKLAQLQHNIGNRQTNNTAAIAIQEAARTKALESIKTARQNIEAMTLKASRAGYVSVKQSSAGNMFYSGMALPPYQAGDTVRPGMAIAEIPDLDKWEVVARMDELDRGHIALGDKAEMTIIAVPDRKFHGHVKDLGGTTGGFWERHFECKIALDDPIPELRPGMSAIVVMTTDEMRNVLWIPAQALFEEAGRTYVYVRSGKSFATKDVKLVRRNETRAVIDGLAAGQEVALSNPLEPAEKKDSAANPLQAVQK
jgi:multidrug efflux pump subunit AcrA (membrane-fusion protein)